MSKRSPYGRGSRAAACRECGALAADGAQISARALCLDCGHTRVIESVDQLTERDGPHYDEWVRGVVEHARRLISS